MLEDALYIVKLIDGDYAHLQRIDVQTDDLKLVARALLPYEIDEGTQLQYKDYEYSIL